MHMDEHARMRRQRRDGGHVGAANTAPQGLRSQKACVFATCGDTGSKETQPMLIAVIAEPLFQEVDRLWIETIRELHDPQYQRIAPHLTFVFPQACSDPAPIIRHVEMVVARHSAFNAHFRVALPVKDHLSTKAHVYLVPDEGLSATIRLHDDLYRDTLAANHQIDVPYIPHVTIAATENILNAKSIADDLNEETFDIACRIDTVLVLRCDTAHVQILTRIGLPCGPP